MFWYIWVALVHLFFLYLFIICYVLFRSPVYSVSVHPSGKLGLSLGKDKTLRTWNLMTAKTAYVTNIKQGQYLFYYITNVKVFNKHISGKAAGFRPKAGSCAYSWNHSQTNMADQNCNLGNDPESKHIGVNPPVPTGSVPFSRSCLPFTPVSRFCTEPPDDFIFHIFDL